RAHQGAGNIELVAREIEVARYGHAQQFGDAGGAPDRNDGAARLDEFLDLRKSLLLGDAAEPTAVLRGNGQRVDLGSAPGAAAAAGVGAAQRSVGEHEDIEFTAQVPGIDGLRINQRERKLELLEQPARPARGHESAVLVIEADTDGTNGNTV